MAQLTAKGAAMVGIVSLPPALAENDPFLPGEMVDKAQEGVLAFRPRPSPPRAPCRSHARQRGHRPSGAGGRPPRKRHGELLAIVVDRRMSGVG